VFLTFPFFFLGREPRKFFLLFKRGVTEKNFAVARAHPGKKTPKKTKGCPFVFLVKLKKIKKVKN
jgi:hypothetical protein